MTDPIQILSFKAFNLLDESEGALASKHPDGDYEDWKKLDDMMWKTAESFGRVGTVSNAGIDFYTTLDWWHHLSHGFGFLSPWLITVELLRAFQQTAVAHHEHTYLSFGACKPYLSDDVDEQGRTLFNESYAMRFLITPSVIAVSCHKRSAAFCRRELNRVGIDLS